MMDRVALTTREVKLGRLGENNHMRILFPISKYLEMYPDAHFTLLNKRPGESSAYPVAATELDDEYLYWTVANTDLTKTGYGNCELIVLQGDVVAKSYVYMTYVDLALDDSGEVVEPWDSWMERFSGIAADAAISADSASNSATAAEAAKLASKQAQDASEAAQSASENAQAGSEAAQAKAETAQQKAEAAQSDAETARDAVETARDEAETSASEAHQSQTSAAQSASAASASALISEGYATGQQDGTLVTSGDYYHNNAEYYARQAGESAEQADEASRAIQDMSVSASTLEPGSQATVSKEVNPDTGTVKLQFGLPTGLTPDMSIGTVVTGEPGSDASASITGTDEEPVLNLTIPRGDTGLPGIEASVSDHTLIITKNTR